MARVLVTVQPLESHVRAIQQAVRTLRLLGHEVLLAAPEKVRDLIERTYDLPYVRAGQDWTKSPGIADRLTNTLIENGNRGFCRTLIEEYLTGPTSIAKARDVARVIEDFRADAILCDCTDIGSLVTAWRLGLPCVSLDNGWTRPLNEFADSIPVGLRRHWGHEIDAAEFVATHLPPVITPCPKELVYPDIPHITDYRVEHPYRVGAKLFNWVADLPADRPLVYASYGSILTQASGFAPIILPVYRRIIEALGQLRCFAVLSVGRENARRLAGDLPDNVRLTARIDQPLLLQAGVDAIVTPGGLGTIKELLTNAVSPVVLPLCSENFHVADRFEETGLGVQTPFSSEPETIAQAVAKVLDEPSYRHTSRQWQRRALVLPPLESVLGQLLP